MRLQRSLNGRWQFQLDPQGTLQVATLVPDREIMVPLPWQAAFPELQQYSGYAWYRTQVALDTSWLGRRLLLSFGAVDYWCEVFINRHRVCEHEGGYTPFMMDIAPFVQAGENELTVRVYDPAQAGLTIPRWPQNGTYKSSQVPFDAQSIPHGKQEWYINIGGIWQDVTLTSVPASHIQHVRITPNIHQHYAEINVEVANPVAQSMVVVEIEANRASIPLQPDEVHYSLQVTVPSPRLWTPDTPELYTAHVRLESVDGRNTIDELDELAVRFGFREITTRDGELLLNGEPIFLLSALDQDFYPDTIYTVPSSDYLRDQFAKAKALGLNSLRCHIKVPDPVYLDLADEMGLLIWAEIPSWRTWIAKSTVHPEVLVLDPAVKARVRYTLEEMIRRDYNHPSLVIWTIVNEDWGTALPFSAEDRAWLAEMYDLCKQLDPTRLVVDNSPCSNMWGPNVHVKSDLDDFHIYTNIPDQASSWVKSLEQFDSRPLWTYSAHGDVQRTGQEPLILSEFGNWGMPSMRNLKAQTGAEPHWFTIGSWWGWWESDPGWPAGVEERFVSLGLNAIWPDYEAFAAATQRHQFAAMKFEIETMRRLANIKGYVITELTDIYWESNGLLDFYRNPKVYHDQFASINAPDVIIPQFHEYAYWDNRVLAVRLHGAHYSSRDWSNARLSWSLESLVGDVQLKDLERGTVTWFGTVRLKLPKVSSPRMVPLHLSLTAVDGVELATNKTEVLVLPTSANRATYTKDIAVMMWSSLTSIDSDSNILSAGHATDVLPNAPTTEESPSAVDITPEVTHVVSDFATVMRSLGYHASTRMSKDTRLIVSNYPTRELLNWVREGGDMLYLSDSPGPFFWRSGRATVFGGSWITSFSWLRPDVHRRLLVDNPLTLPYANVTPTGVILGLPVEDRSVHQDFLAGQVSGWLRHPALHTVQFRYGKGRVIMTTYKLKDTLEQNPQDPVASSMLHDLIDHLVECQPVLRANY